MDKNIKQTYLDKINSNPEEILNDEVQLKEIINDGKLSSSLAESINKDRLIVMVDGVRIKLINPLNKPKSDIMDVIPLPLI